MGGRSADGDNGRVPLLLAEALDWPCLTQVTDFKLKGDCLEVANLIDDGELVQIVRPPVILAVGNAPATYLRVPTLKDKMSHGKREIERPTPSENAVSPAYELRLLRYEQHERDAVIIEGSTPAEKAERLYYDYLKDRL
jgi:Electron transfer flavoprotein, beta subunit